MAKRQLQDISELSFPKPHQHVISGPKVWYCMFLALWLHSKTLGLVHNSCQYLYFFLSRLGLTSQLEYFSVWQQCSLSTYHSTLLQSSCSPFKKHPMQSNYCILSHLGGCLWWYPVLKWGNRHPDNVLSPVLISFKEKHRQEVTVLSREAGLPATDKQSLSAFVPHLQNRGQNSTCPDAARTEVVSNVRCLATLCICRHAYWTNL